MGVWAGALISVKNQSETDGFVCLIPSLNHFLSLLEHLVGGLNGFVQNFSAGLAGLIKNRTGDLAGDSWLVPANH